MSSQGMRFMRWRFSAGVLAPATLSLLAAAAGVLGFVLWSTSDIDARFVQRQSQVVAHIIATEIEAIPREQESVARSDDAIRNMRPVLDMPWVTAHFGNWMRDYFGHDLLLVLNAEDQPVFRDSAGSLEAYQGLETAIQPLLARLREEIADGALRPVNPGQPAPLLSVSDLLVVDDMPSIVSLVPIVGHSGTLEEERGHEYVHVAVQQLDAAFAAEIAHGYRLEGASFTTVPSGENAVAARPLVNRNGRLIGFFQWQPDRPGQDMLKGMAPALAAGFLLAGVTVFVLLDRLWRSSDALETGRRTAMHEANHDPLTGLPNRTHFDRQLESTLVESSAQRRELALLMLDLDQFKHVNDTLGHPAGDKLIWAASERLRAQLDGQSSICRLGGDEFAILYSTEPGSQDVANLSQRLIEVIGAPFDIDNNEVFVGLSVGIAFAHEDSTTYELVRNADIALYEAKAGGRNRSVVYEERMNELLQLRRIIEAELREALRHDDQLSLAFQPLVDGKTGEVVGAEALARWSHPKFGDISPAKFIPVAESTGLIEALGDFILRSALELGSRWPGQRIAVNVSPAQLRNPKFPLRVFKLLKQTGMRPQDLELEITEGILLEDRQLIVEALRSFRNAGIQISLDDFGTGYSSLSYLKRYEVDRIKIDRSFIQHITESEASAEIVRAMVTLAHALDLEVTAEGVETEEQRALLVTLGCDALQGYHFSRPVPIEPIEEMLSTRSWQQRRLGAYDRRLMA